LGAQPGKEETKHKPAIPSWELTEGTQTLRSQEISSQEISEIAIKRPQHCLPTNLLEQVTAA
jgi:hypothetical protein